MSLHCLPSEQNYQKIPQEPLHSAQYQMIALFRSAPFPVQYNTEKGNLIQVIVQLPGK